ncbi:SRPBCC family protein [Sulfurovum sp.]|jgi:ligand-binding SRPBCC domain-containing protein|uniref:SRPBCC family protein n=1 Tax=Sulfurovum sp. TaxID=1969726 RepID=UPI0025D5DF28|nr:SRPBCC family protein [Sulfurovum sp.]
MKHTLIFETKVPCSVKTLFDFHADTNNLPLITPKDTTVEILKLESPLKEGNEAVLRIKKGWLAFTWELTFEKVEYPNIIVDVATRSPFKTFRHEHHFIEVDAAHSILRDVVTFSLPLEPLSFIAVWFAKRDMQKMFAYRHAQTLKYLSQEIQDLRASKAP